MKQITENEASAIRNALVRMNLSNLADCGNITDEITGVSFRDFFADLPSVVMELSQHGDRYQAFINSLDKVSGILNAITERNQILMDAGYFFECIDSSNHKG
ncbi:MAG: hypothetical protein J6N70_16440 [Oribacterium sp.]|jgi:hypothetical protein|nr:hypothetical protein [Oribacterium sp.]